MQNKNLTWEQIKNEYKHQYVGLCNVHKDSNDEIISADVVCSTKTSNYEDMLEQAILGNIFMVNPSADEENKAGICV